MDSERGEAIARLRRMTCLVEDAILVGLLAAMIGLAAAQILLRNLFDTGFAWADPLLRVLILWVALAGAMVAAREKGHIAVNVLLRYLPLRGRSLAAAAASASTGVICVLAAYHSALFVLAERAAGTPAFAGVPAWVCELILPFAFGVIAVHYLLHALDDLRQLPSRTPGA